MSGTRKPISPAKRQPDDARVSSGDRGASAVDLFARIEKLHPGIEEKIGLSSAALKAGGMVREMRHAKGWTQVELADKLGWDQVRISNIERGEGVRGPTFEVLSKIAGACEYELEFRPRALPGSANLDDTIEIMAQQIVDEAVYSKIGRKRRLDDQAILERVGREAVAGIGTGVEVTGALHRHPLTDEPYIVVSGSKHRVLLRPLAVEEVQTEAAADADVEQLSTER
jgi:transcriptional regulator with XRE-family HTH domain